MAREMDDFDNAGRDDGETEERMDSAAIRAEIRETRERMSQTLDGLGERLNPQVLKQQVRDEIEERKQAIKNNIREATIGRAQHMARDAAGRVTDTRRGIADAIRDNPIPAAMVGIGLGWLLYNGRRNESYGETEIVYQPRADNFMPLEESPGTYHEPGRVERAREWAGDATSGVRERAQAITGRATEAVGDLADRAREVTSDLVDRTTTRTRSAAGSLADTTRSRADTLETRFHDAVVDNPLVIGAAAIALGLTAGLAVPTTRREAELMGPKRDELFNRARGMAEDATGRVQQVAQRVAEEAQDSAKEAMQTLKSTVTEAAQDLQSTAREAAQEQGLMSSGKTGTTGPQSAGAGAGNAFATPSTPGVPPTPRTTPASPTTGTGTGAGAFSPGTGGGSIADPRGL